MALATGSAPGPGRHPLVRDLAWLLLTPDMIAMPWPGRPTRDELGLGDDDRLRAWLAALEAAPEALEAHLAPTLQGRMGLYHERLWQFLLAQAPGTRLLAHNVRIAQGKRTLGELDLLYARRGSCSPVHLEVAIKFYLGLTEGPGPANSQARWIGPSGADSLAIKREHLARHQLRLAATDEARETLAPLFTALAVPDATERVVPQARLAMPGVLFSPWQSPLPAPCEATPTHLRGRWVSARDWPHLRHGLARHTRGAWLQRPHWLALPPRAAHVSLDELDARLAQHFRDNGAAVQLALWHPEHGSERIFVVANDWPRQVPLPPGRGEAVREKRE